MYAWLTWVIFLHRAQMVDDGNYELSQLNTDVLIPSVGCRRHLRRVKAPEIIQAAASNRARSGLAVRQFSG